MGAQRHGADLPLITWNALPQTGTNALDATRSYNFPPTAAPFAPHREILCYNTLFEERYLRHEIDERTA